MTPSTISALVQALGDPQQRSVARTHLIAGDEAIISTLIDEFYAGVSVTVGIELLDVIGQIGGYEAVQCLQDVHTNGRTDWRVVAGRWLRRDGFLPPDAPQLDDI